MDSFALEPLQEGYKPQPSNMVAEQELLGGFARQRVTFVNNVHTVNVSVMIESKDHAQYFWAFWRKHAMFTPQQFLWVLIITDPDMTQYSCQFIPSSIQVGERSGNLYKISFTVRCKPKPLDAEFDQAILEAWLGGPAFVWASLLEKLVNVDLPKI